MNVGFGTCTIFIFYFLSPDLGGLAFTPTLLFCLFLEIYDKYEKYNLC